MNTGLIPVRYATALLEFANVSGEQDRVYTEVKSIMQSYFQFNELKVVLDNPVLAKPDKQKIIILAGGGSVSKSFERFVNLLLENNRETHLLSIALKYIDLFRKQKNIHYGKLTTAFPVDEVVENRLMAMVENTTGGSVEMEKIIDPDILGGFMFEVDFVRWDASISGQLRRIRMDYIERNKKVV